MAWVRRRLNRVELRLDLGERRLRPGKDHEVGAGELGRGAHEPDTDTRLVGERLEVVEVRDPWQVNHRDVVPPSYGSPGIRLAHPYQADHLGWNLDPLRLSEEEALTWVRALNHLRLVAGARLGIDDDGWEERSDASMLEREEYAMLVTLGWVQENVVAALGS